jgi:phenylacetic acid degradation operon negative regulatory protein
MPTDAFISQIAALRALGGRRVWSLMISLFGDLAQAQDEAIDGPVLSKIMGGLQVKPEAVRVALHRLRNDGWLTSTKSGRISQHTLTAKGRTESAAASPRIYAAPGEMQGAWQMVMIADTHILIDADFAMITPRIYVGAATLPVPENALCFTGEDVPEWLRQQAEPVHLRAEYRALHRTLATLNEALPNTCDMSATEAAVLRCLIVHNWRRLVLKHPALPTALISPDWPGAQCHLLVADLLARFPPPALSLMDHRRAA